MNKKMFIVCVVFVSIISFYKNFLHLYCLHDYEKYIANAF
ncbi:hypothetical protein BVAVS116_H0031 (plasmid) [Borreliella valaisiana VS116]|uniref:Uncharacterized protein n=1 Tax=Borreliella valaisiana VS116 TaxID=445987 RepID=C0R988_BORVA|nr:hypothetical protein BVAVS116_H0031 [Borreliella valaisiana VS116]